MASTDKMMVIKYKDNNVIALAFNFESASIGRTERYSRKKNANIQHPQPVAVKNYNTFIGEVDQQDE